MEKVTIPKKPQIYDQQRTEYLRKKGIKVIRYTNEDVYKRIDAVYQDLMEVFGERRNT